MNSGYKYEIRCKICTAKDKSGVELRPDIEEMEAKGQPRRILQQFLLDKGTYASKRSFHIHFEKHASYVKTIPSKATSKMITTITHQRIESQHALEKIIAMSDQMIDNWWNQVENTPQMPVTEKLFIEAVKEEGRRAPKTLIGQELEQIEKEFIERRNEK